MDMTNVSNISIDSGLTKHNISVNGSVSVFKWKRERESVLW